VSIVVVLQLLHPTYIYLTRKFNFRARRLVGKVNLVVDKNRVDGTRVRLAEVEVGDETGIVSLRARDEQVDILNSVSERSGAVVLRNCTLELYQGKHLRIAVTKWGKLGKHSQLYHHCHHCVSILVLKAIQNAVGFVFACMLI